MSVRRPLRRLAFRTLDVDEREPFQDIDNSGKRLSVTHAVDAKYFSKAICHIDCRCIVLLQVNRTQVTMDTPVLVSQMGTGVSSVDVSPRTDRMTSR